MSDDSNKHRSSKRFRFSNFSDGQINKPMSLDTSPGQLRRMEQEHDNVLTIKRMGFSDKYPTGTKTACQSVYVQ